MAKRKSRNSLYTFVIIGILLLLSLTVLLVTQLQKSQELRSRAFDPYSSPYPPPPEDTIKPKPSPKPRDIILNSASNKSCRTVCNERNARVIAVGTSITVQGKSNNKYATKTLGVCELKDATYDTIMKPVGPAQGGCYGHTPEWTFCGCVGRDE